MTQHTPEPWTVSKEQKTVFVDISVGSSACRVYGANEADARLIAAAPALLAFAQYILELDPESDAPMFAKARAVVKEATNGRTQHMPKPHSNNMANLRE